MAILLLLNTSAQNHTTMDIKIYETGFSRDIYGFSGIAVNKDYTGTAFKLMDKMWKTIRQLGIKNKGINIWVYEENEKVFTGVETYEAPPPASGLEHKNITLVKYAAFMHRGPYNLIKKAGQDMNDDLKRKGFETVLPYIEMYGHHTNDPSAAETELLMCLK